MRILLNPEESIGDLIMKLNGNFTDEEKEKCVPIIRRLVSLSHSLRTNGILGLEEEMEDESNVFLKTALFLILAGNSPETLKQVLQNMIVADSCTGSELLERLLIAEGMLAAQRWESPETVELKLSSMLGMNYVLPMKDTCPTQSEITKKYDDFLKKVKDKVALAESNEFETQMLQLIDQPLQLVVHCIDNENLILALQGCGFELIRKVLDNVSIRRCLRICENWNHFHDFDSEIFISAQEDILNVIKTLDDVWQIMRTSTESDTP